MSSKIDDPELYFTHHIFCCTNQRDPSDPRGSCQAKGSVRLRNYFKRKAKEEGIDNVRVNAAGCLDRCEFGPTLVIYPEGIWYSVTCEADIDKIIEIHLKRHERVASLMLDPDQEAPET